MVLGAILGTILGSKSHPKTDVGSILEGFWPPTRIHFGPILAPKIDRKSRSIFDAIFKNLRGESGVGGGAQGGRNYHRT